MFQKKPFPFARQFAFQQAHLQPVPSTRTQHSPGRWLFADDDETVRAQRRRKGSGPSGRAEMPSRPSAQPGGSRPPSYGGGTSGGGRARLPIGLVILVIIGYFVIQLLSGGIGEQGGSFDQQNFQDQSSDTDLSGGEVQQPTEVVATNTPRPTRTPGAGTSGGDTWTVLLYQDADDEVLEQDIFLDFNEAERVGSSDKVNIVAQIDRYAGGFDGDGNWSSTRRYYLTQDRDLNRINSELVEDLGEVSMADPQTLVDFVTWAVKAYPADKYALILSDHGMGWPGGWTDPRPSTPRNVNIPLAQGLKGNMLYTHDIDQALEQIRRQTGIDRFEMIGMDACLMAHLEVFSAMAPHTRYLLASQETEPALGWAYSSFLGALEKNPAMDGAQLGELIVSSYIVEDERILDDEARAEFLRQGSPMQSLFGRPADVDPRQLSRQIGRTITLTAADLDALPGLIESVDRLAYAMQSDNQSVVARVRTYAQSFTSIFGKEVPASYIDLGDFAALLRQESGNAAVRSAAQEVIDQIGRVVIAEKHGPEKPGSTGVSIYFPNSQLYRSPLTGAQSYTIASARFAEGSLWDDFLAYHYTKQSFELETRGNVVVPGAGVRVSGPGVGQLQVSPLQLSSTETDYDQPVLMRATISGQNIGYVYLFVGYLDPGSNSILVADKDYLESPTTRRVGDTFYPQWSDGETFNLEFEWLPTVFAISDGEETVVALLEPTRYGATAEEAVYTTEGIYTFVASGESRYARLYFSNGQLQQVFTFTDEGQTGAPREVIPQTGDQVTLIQTWLEQSGNAYRQVTEQGETLTFGAETLTWQELYASAGQYVLGFVVSDLDGNQQQVFGTLRVR